jgi:hypothetical protein
MTEARRLSTFLAETLKRDDVPGRLRKLVVSHIIKGNKIGDEIRAVSIPAEAEADEDWQNATAAKIVEQAASEAVTLAAGVQRYAVQCFFEGDEKPHGRHVFTCQGPDEDEDQIGTEGPDETGLVAASQRHTEFFAQAFGRASIAQLKSLQEENASLRKENAEMRRERIDSFKVMESIYSDQHKRALENRAAAVKGKLLEDSADKLSLMLPIAINHFAGRKVLPETSTETLMLKSFAESITRDQLDQLVSIFKPEQSAIFIRMMTQVSKPADPAPPASTNGVSP